MLKIVTPLTGVSMNFDIGIEYILKHERATRNSDKYFVTGYRN